MSQSFFPSISRRAFLKVSAVTAALAAVGAKLGNDAPLLQHALAAPLAAGEETFGYTYCDMCNQVPKCGVKVYVRDGVVTRLESRTNYPNDPLCAKGMSLLQEEYHPARLLYPMKRTAPKGTEDSKWVRISWDEAYDTIAKKLNEIKTRDGADKVLFMTGDPKEMRPPLQRLAYTFGSPNYGTESSTCARATQVAAMLTFGFSGTGAMPSAQTKTCLIWSKNTAWSGPYDMWKLLDAKDRGCKFIVVDPRLTPTVRNLADIHLQLRPGTDGALALGLIHVVIKENLYDADFVGKWVHGFDELKEYVKEFTPDKVEKITWVSAAKIVEAARLFATTRPATWIGSASPTVHSVNAAQNHRAILSLYALTGNIDTPGGWTLATNPLPTADGAFNRYREIGVKMTDKRADIKAFPVWAEINDEIQVNLIPEYVKEGKIKAGVFFGVNAMMWPQSHEYQEAFKNMEFAVAVDYFTRPWTHNFVDMILPSATALERMAPLAVFGRQIFHRKPVVKPLGEAREDWQIIFELGAKFGYGKEFWNGNVEAGINFILEPVNLTSEKLLANPEMVAIVPPPGPEQYKKYELGLLRADKKPGFNTPTGKVEIASEVLKKHKLDPLPVYKEPLESPISTPDLAKKFPLILNTGSRLPFYTHSKLRELPWLREIMPHPVVRISPADATKRGLKDGDDVVLETSLGSIKMKVEVTNLVMPGVTDIFHGWQQANVNELITRKFDPISGYPPFKEGLCEVRKA